MGKSAQPTLLQGTLDLLILHALQRGAMHGYAIAQTFHLLSDEVLKVEEGSLYPALYRLELDGAISAKYGLVGEQPESEVLRNHQTRQETSYRTRSHLESFFYRGPARSREVTIMRRLFLKLFRRRRLQQDLETELAFHRAMSGEHHNPIPLGNEALIKERAFDLWRFNFIENLWRDLVYGRVDCAAVPGWSSARCSRLHLASASTPRCCLLEPSLDLGKFAVLFPEQNGGDARP